MQRKQVPTLITIALLANLPAANAAAQAPGIQDAECERINFPAEANFDFTETISRWGSRGSFDIDGSQYQIRNISLAQLPIFDESNRKEDLALYRWINRIHVDTQPEVIRNQLLFVSGDSVSSGTMAESERILRHQKYVSDSKLRVLQKCQNQKQG